MRFGVPMMNIGVRSERQLFPAEISRVPVVAAGNLNVVVDERLNSRQAMEKRSSGVAEVAGVTE